MSNPIPRTNSLLSKYVRLPSTGTELAASVPTGLPAHEEKKANEIVARIIEESDKILAEPVPVEYESDYDEEIAEYERDSREDTDSGYREVKVPTNFRLPPEESCGLFDPSITLDESQSNAVAELIKHQYACLIGAAGTGKTTVQKYMIRELIYRDDSFRLKHLPEGQGLNIAMVAFTGMAVQVMKRNLPAWLGGCCKTIHGLLEFAPEQIVSDKTGKATRIFSPQRHAMRKLDHDIIFIDEASMVGIDLWVQLIAACRMGTRIYMTGDLNQLPPIIGQPIFGYVLGDWAVYELTKVHRQKEAGANRIIEVAHQVLNGQPLTFDHSKGNPDWRVLFQPIEANPAAAQKQILSVLNQLRKIPVDREDPDSTFIYDPHRDRVMTAGNGFDDTLTSSMVQQAPLNEHLSLIIQPPDAEHPRYIIDAGRSQKKFAVNLRVMATKNEAPNALERVTNGLAGIITSIEPNPRYTGDHGKFGTEENVMAEIRRRLAGGFESTHGSLEELSNYTLDSMDEISSQTPAEAEEGGASSHVISVKFDNGAHRTYSTKAGVESLQLAFCSTVAKCQGSQFDTAVIVCHHADKSQLSREWLYTAITRASKRVIILGTDYALRYAVNRQKIKGRNLPEKIERYRAMCNEGLKVGYTRVKMNVPLRVEDYDGAPIRSSFALEAEE